MISHLSILVTFKTNSVSESRQVGHLIMHFKSIYFHVVNSLMVQIHTHMQIFDKHFKY